MYRNFVHPSGFHLASETVLEGIGNVEILTAESFTDPFANSTRVFASAQVILGQPFASTSILIRDNEDADSASQRMDPLSLCSMYSNYSMDSIASWYSNIDEWGGLNSLTMDDADSGSAAITFDHTLKTFDHQQFQTYSYGSTSTI
jgi:hypothetical protein